MWEEAVASWPFIPWSVAWLLLVPAMAGAIIAMRDWGARDSSLTTGIAMTLLAVAFIGAIGIGTWNFGVAVAKLGAQHQQELATSSLSR